MRRTAAMLGTKLVKVSTYSRVQMEEQGMHEIVEMRYLFESPLLVDSSDTEAILGVEAQSLDVMIADTLRDHI
jgi:hypothetical protein